MLKRIQLKNYNEFILLETLFPACILRLGRPNYKVIKVAMLDIIICLMMN